MPDGRYTVTLTPRDLAGNPGKPRRRPQVDVYAALTALTRTADRRSSRRTPTPSRRKTTAAFTLLSPASVTIRVLDRDGTRRPHRA